MLPERGCAIRVEAAGGRLQGSLSLLVRRRGYCIVAWLRHLSYEVAFLIKASARTSFAVI